MKRRLYFFILNHKDKSTIKYNAFISASKEADGYLVNAPYGVHYSILSLDGKEVSKIGLAEEHEILFKSGTEFNIVSFVVAGNEIQIECEELINNETGLQGITGKTGNQKTSYGNAEQYITDGGRFRNG